MFRNVPKGNNPPVSSSTSPGIYRGNRSRGRGRSRGGAGSGSGFNNRRPNHQDPTKRGLFVDGTWLCNCTPRLPAEHFKVKKEGKNQGRWFYTCQNSEGRRCDFFLWDEDAKPREEAAVLSGRRDEPRAAPGVLNNVQNADAGRTMVQETQRRDTTASQMSTQSQEAPPPYSFIPDSMASGSSATLGRSQQSATNNKRSLAETEFEFDDDNAESFPWDLTGQEADELEQRASHAPETPRKAVKTTSYATPATTGRRQLPWLDYTSENTPAAETPSKSGTLPTPSHTRPTNADATTPTPSRFHDPLAASTASSELTTEVFALLQSSNTSLPPHTSNQLRAILNKHDLKAQGVVKGRDIVRLALKARDAKVVELNARIAALEAEREVDRARIRGLRLKDSTFD